MGQVLWKEDNSSICRFCWCIEDVTKNQVYFQSPFDVREDYRSRSARLRTVYNPRTLLPNGPLSSWWLMTSIYIRLQLQFSIGMWASGKFPLPKVEISWMLSFCYRFLKTKVWLHHYINFVAKSNLLITNLLTNLHSSIPKLRLHYGSDDDGAIKGGHGIFEVPRWQVAPVGKMWGCFFFHFPEGGLGITTTLKITPNYKARTLTGVGF